MKIHPNLESAILACKIHSDKVDMLSKQFGVWEEVHLAFCCIYLDKNGEQQFYYHK
jgi:hypothetical protein